MEEPDTDEESSEDSDEHLLDAEQAAGWGESCAPEQDDHQKTAEVSR